MQSGAKPPQLLIIISAGALLGVWHFLVQQTGNNRR